MHIITTLLMTASTTLKSTILNEMNVVTRTVKEANKSIQMHKARFLEKTKNHEKVWTGENTHCK